MYIPQYVSYVKKKKGTNITILKRGKNIIKCQLQISYTNIISEDLCSLSIPLTHWSRLTSTDVANSVLKFGGILFTPIQ